jgi:hypothetical protein
VKYTEQEAEKHGDAVLMTWRDWVNLRDLVQERLEESKSEGMDRHVASGYRAALHWVMQTMDETLP